MKKICFVTTISLTIKCFIIDMAKFLQEQGDYDISIICSSDAEFAKSLPNSFHYYPVDMRRGVNLDGIKAIHDMTRIFKREKFDIIQYSTPNASLYAAIAAFLTKTPTRLYCQWGIAYVGYRGAKRIILKTLEKTVCRLSTRVEPDSKSNLAYSIAEGLYFSKKAAVIWNGSASGVNLAKFDARMKVTYRNTIRNMYNISPEAFVFGFVGRITGDKGINELFSAMKLLLNDDCSVYLLIVGNPEKSDSVDSELYSWAENNEHIIFCGYSNVVEQYVSAMDCFVLPSYREGFGLGVVEAESMETAVIITDIPGPTDAIIEGKTGITVKKKDALALYNAMSLLKCDKEKCKELGQNGRRFAEEYFDQNRLFQFILEDRDGLISK